MAPCDVHVLLHGDHEDRDVRHCDACDANLCVECRTRYDLRAVAAIKAAARRALVGLGMIEGEAHGA